MVLIVCLVILVVELVRTSFVLTEIPLVVGWIVLLDGCFMDIHGPQRMKLTGFW